MKVINLFGGPGSGKSTLASGVFSLLKLHGVNCELITEFAKDLVWEKRKKTLENQTYILGKQHHKIWRIPKSIEIVVTDSPIVQGILYIDKSDSTMIDFTIKKFNEFDNINYFLNRVKPYNPDGRNQTENEAKELDSDIIKLIKSCILEYKILDGDYKSINKIVADILQLLGYGKPKIFLSNMNIY